MQYAAPDEITDIGEATDEQRSDECSERAGLYGAESGHQHRCGGGLQVEGIAQEEREVLW